MESTRSMEETVAARFEVPVDSFYGSKLGKHHSVVAARHVLFTALALRGESIQSIASKYRVAKNTVVKSIDVSAKGWFAATSPLYYVFIITSRVLGVSCAFMASKLRLRPVSQARNMVAHLSVNVLGLKKRDVAAHLGWSRSNLKHALITFENDCKTNALLAGQLEKAIPEVKRHCIADRHNS